MDIGDIKYLEVKEAPKVLKLSEAIRIGSKIRPQCFGRLFVNGGSCAFGAAYEARGGRYEEMASFRIFSRPESAIPLTEWGAAELAYRAAYGRPPWGDNDRLVPRETIADYFAAIGL